MKKGLTLVEIMVAILIFSWLITGSVFLYGRFIDASLSERRKIEKGTSINIALKLIDRDIKMAGFAMPDEVSLVIEGGLSPRVFLADGWEILRDFTDNNEEDGRIDNTIYGEISSIKEQEGGYVGTLSETARTNTTRLVLDNLNINRGSPTIPFEDIDFKKGRALIIGNNNLQEGYMISEVNTQTNSIELAENLRNTYPPQTLVVPAICYSIRTFENRNWLFRNNAPLLEDVERMEVTSIAPKMLRVNLAVSSRIRRDDTTISKLSTYTTTVEMRN